MSSRLIAPLLALNILSVIGAIAAFFLWSTQNHAVNSAAEGATARVGQIRLSEYQFLDVNKIYVALKGNGADHYMVMDLAVQVSADVDKKELQQFAPVVRNAVVSRLSGMRYAAVRDLGVKDLQKVLEEALSSTIFERNLKVSFEHVLINRLLVQPA